MESYSKEKVLWRGQGGTENIIFSWQKQINLSKFLAHSTRKIVNFTIG